MKIKNWMANRKGDMVQIVLHKSMDSYFASLPESSKNAIIEALEDQISPILKTYSARIGVKPVDFVLQMQYNDMMKSKVKNLAKSESLYNIVHRDSLDAWTGIAKIISSLARKSTNEDLSKSLRNAAVGLGLLGALGSVSSTQPAVQDVVPHSFPSKFKGKPWGSQREDAFLHNLMQLESSGGKKTDHQPTKRGTGAGQTAIGRWGLIPTTIREITRKKSMQGNPEIARMGSMSDGALSQYVKENPEVELHLARSLARHVMGRFKDPGKAAYSWLYGHNLSPASITPEKIARDKYTQDFLALNSGKSVRGLKPHTQDRSIAMAKSEQGFKTRVDTWLKHRKKKDQERVDNVMVRTGDRAEPARAPLEEKDKVYIAEKEANMANPMDRVKVAIEKAKK